MHALIAAVRCGTASSRELPAERSQVLQINSRARNFRSYFYRYLESCERQSWVKIISPNLQKFQNGNPARSFSAAQMAPARKIALAPLLAASTSRSEPRPTLTTSKNWDLPPLPRPGRKPANPVEAEPAVCPDLSLIR